MMEIPVHRKRGWRISSIDRGEWMKNSRWALRSAIATAAGLAVAAGLPAGLASAQGNSSDVAPMVKLVVAQKSINVPRFGRRVFLDPGVYVTAVGSAPQVNVRPASRATPPTQPQNLRGRGVAPIPR